MAAAFFFAGAFLAGAACFFAGAFLAAAFLALDDPAFFFAAVVFDLAVAVVFFLVFVEITNRPVRVRIC